ncbi:MAG: serine hydrolase [Fimbriimonadaceae bacterium]|nr:serine hydrolase [Fimbriimonadaceae bacterium]
MLLPFTTLVPAPSLAEAVEYSEAHAGLAVSIWHDGKPVLSRSRAGVDPAAKHLMASGSKSFAGVVAAAAVDDGLIAWDERVSETLEEWKADVRKAKITVRHLLTLTSGLRPNAPMGTVAAGRAIPWPVSVDAPANDEPGSRFTYGPTAYGVFGAFLDRKVRAKGMAGYEAYMNQRVLEPLGITIRWQKAEDGSLHLPGGGSISADDWVKFGVMMLGEGESGGKRILRAERVRELTTGTEANPAYGITWWLNRPVPEAIQRSVRNFQGDIGAMVNADSIPRDLYMAAGAGKQRLYVIPSRRLVIARLARLGGGREFSDAEFLKRVFAGVGQ